MSEPEQVKPDGPMPGRMLCADCAAACRAETFNKAWVATCERCGDEEALVSREAIQSLRVSPPLVDKHAPCAAELDDAEAYLAAGRRVANKQEFGVVAGIVKTPGIDDVLDTVESEQDVVAANKELLEGTQQSRAELERWRMLYQATLVECNRQLLPRGICLGACAPNPNGLGAVFVGVDREQRDYTVTLTLPARERVDFERASKEDFVRWAIKAVCDEVVEQQERYLKRMGRS